MAAAEELMDGDGAMLEADGVAAGAEEVDAVVLEPPQAVRLSMAAAAIPATAKVVRLMVCILVSPLLCRALPAAEFSALALFRLVGHRPLVGVSMGIRGVGGLGWVRD
jgi:hypothetical protein